MDVCTGRDTRTKFIPDACELWLTAIAQPVAKYWIWANWGPAEVLDTDSSNVSPGDVERAHVPYMTGTDLACCEVSSCLLLRDLYQHAEVPGHGA